MHQAKHKKLEAEVKKARDAENAMKLEKEAEVK